MTTNGDAPGGSSTSASAEELLRRADDMYFVGVELVRRAGMARWQCARADRFREAMRGRQIEATRLANVLQELGYALRARAAAEADPTAPPAAGT